MKIDPAHFREARTPVQSHVAAVFVIALTVFAGSSARGDDPSPNWNPQATENYLNARAEWWLDWSSSARGHVTSCVSCHTAVPYAIARPALAKLPGGRLTLEAEKRLLASVRTRVEKWEEIVSAETEGKDPLIPFYGGSRRESALDT